MVAVSFVPVAELCSCVDGRRDHFACMDAPIHAEIVARARVVLLSDRDWKRASAAKRTFPILEHGRQRERCGVWTKEKIANATFIVYLMHRI